MMKRLLLMLAMFALPCLVWAQEPAYSFIVFPDYQYMSSGGDMNKLAAVPTWISANKATYAPNLLFMASTGDDVDTSNSTQWGFYTPYFYNNIMAMGIPFGSDVGNHDYDGSPANPTSRATTLFTSNLLTASNGVQNQTYYGGAWSAAVTDPEVNYWLQIPNGSNTIGLLFLEFCPRAAALSWGAGIVAAHPSFSDWWVFTHEAVTSAGALSTPGTSGTSACFSTGSDGTSDSVNGGGTQLWSALQAYPNVRGIFNGHFSGGAGAYANHVSGNLTGTNGNSVLASYVNHQFDAPGLETCFTIYQVTPGTTTMGLSVTTGCPNAGGTGVFGWQTDDSGNDSYTTTLTIPTTKTLTAIALLPPTAGYYTSSSTGTVQLTPLCTYDDTSTDNCTASGITLTWGSDNPSAMSVSSSGLATALSSYSTFVDSGQMVAPSHIFAYNGSVLGSAGIYVDGVPVTVLYSTPETSTGPNNVVAGSTVLVSAVGNNTSSGIYVGEYCAWTSSNTSIATVNQIGEVYGVSAGMATITCTLGSLTVGRSVTVVAAPTGGNTWYVRPNGGTRYDAAVTAGQCNGTVDADYPGTGTNQNCAFSNPMYLFTDETSSTVYTGALNGGDTAIIHPSTVPYPVVYKNSTTKWITAAATGTSAGSAGAMWPPSGSPAQPTRILGSNYLSCTGSPHAVGNRSAMVSYNGVSEAFLLYGDQNVDIECLDISTGVDCNQGLDATYFACPNGDTHNNSLIANDFTSNITLTNDRIHGYMDGWTGTPGPGLVMTGVSVEDNYLDGLNFDNPYGAAGNRSDGFTAQGLFSTYNGCTDEQPKTLSSVSRDGAGNLNATFGAGQLVNYEATTNLVLTGMTPSDLNGTFPVSSITFNQQSVTITGGTVGRFSGDDGVAEAVFTTSTAPTFIVGAFVNIVSATPSYLNGYYEVFAVSGTGFTVVAGTPGHPGWTTTSGSISAGGTASTAISLVASAAGGAESASTVGTAGHVYSAHRCNDQASGGNGDGVGTGDDTIGSWTCNQCTIQWNTQDGWDMLHSHMVRSTFTNSYSAGNQGAPSKFGYADVGVFDNNVLIGNAMVNASFDPNRAPDANQYLGMLYRAGDTFPEGMMLWSNLVITNNTFETGFSVIVDSACKSLGGCSAGVSGVSQAVFQNNVFIGFLDQNSPVYSGSFPAVYCDNVCDGSGPASAIWTWNNNIWYNTKTFAPTYGANNLAATNPLVVTMIPSISTPVSNEYLAQTFNLNLTTSSPAKWAGVQNSYVPSTDNVGYTWNNPPSMGALEYQGGSSSNAGMSGRGGITGGGRLQ